MAIKDKSRKISRKGFFKSFANDIQVFINELFGEELERLQSLFPALIRPPGAGRETAFLKSCIKCHRCIKVCPYMALKPALATNEFDKDTPVLSLGSSFCRFCDNFPCVVACPTEALSTTNNLNRLGLAIVLPDKCLRQQNISCNACEQICRQSAKAIKCNEMPSVPEIDSKLCSGCGACLTVCPVTPRPALTLKRDA